MKNLLITLMMFLSLSSLGYACVTYNPSNGTYSVSPDGRYKRNQDDRAWSDSPKSWVCPSESCQKVNAGSLSYCAYCGSQKPGIL